MAFDVVMPQMGESIAEATLLKWHRAVGETIGKDETLYEISTDKVDAEIPSPMAGTLLEILVDVNQTVPVGSVVARIGEVGELGSKPATAVTQARPESSATVQVPLPALQNQAESGLEDRLLSKSSPLVRKMAEAHGIDLHTVKGTGTMGRVTREDIEEHIARMKSGTHSASGPAHDPSAPTAGSIPALAIPPQPSIPAFAPGERVKVEPMSRMRKLISDHMIVSKQTSAHVYTVFEMDMSHLSKLRAKHRKDFEETHGAKLSYLPFVMQAVCKALRTFPVLNASLDSENIIYKQDIHLGIAVSLDWGLIVPVVKHADQLNLGGLARALADLAERARAKQLKPEEIQGGTFTLTNPGVFGDTFGLPIINQPQVAILGMGAIKKRPAVVKDADGNDAIAIRDIMFSALSFDHRLVDGATADQFMATIKHELETSTFDLE